MFEFSLEEVAAMITFLAKEDPARFSHPVTVSAICKSRAVMETAKHTNGMVQFRVR